MLCEGMIIVCPFLSIIQATGNNCLQVLFCERGPETGSRGTNEAFIRDKISERGCNVNRRDWLWKGVNYSSKQLIELGITSILHDIGMVFIPQEIVEKNGKLTASELEKIRKHPYYTYKILQTLGEKYSWIAKVAYQEQEREDGRGYPRGLKGDEIHDYAKIIGVVDVYEALTHDRPQRMGYMPHEAVKLLLGTQKEQFSNEIKRLLLTKLSCFPMGSYVKLNSRAICKVIEINEDSPLRPTVEILFDSQDRKLPKRKVINLADAPLLYVTGTVYEAELPH